MATIQEKITHAVLQVKATIGEEFRVSFLTHLEEPALMIGNIRRNHDVEEIISAVTSLFCMDFTVDERDLGCTRALIFIPI